MSVRAFDLAFASTPQMKMLLVQGQARRKGVQLGADLADLPPVSCYPAKINQAVMNLLTNAIDACADGGSVTVRTRSADGAVAIEVRDDGKGIDPAIRERVFDPFFTTKPVGEGIGLGLSITYGIVQDHGGTIEVDSTPGAGSLVTIRLPLHVAK
jgi:signal transduction histidine kinase